MFVTHFLIVCTCLGTNVRADVTTRSNSSTTSTDAELQSTISSVTEIIPSSVFDTDDELTKIANTRLSDTDYEQMTGNNLKAIIARPLSNMLLPECIARLGRQEMLAALKFSPNHPSQKNNDTIPTETELQNASTPEAYYELKSLWRQRIDCQFLFERSVTTGIEFLDARFPSIRVIFKKAFEEKHPRNGVIDKTTVDVIMNEYSHITGRVIKAIQEVLYRFEWDD
ncbi:hypothetical protein B9Z55_005966 [Caenorhabditis nigoni]|nr:hypothetical protein B9Z55_005966 [Caenorhabditis nigoni]